ncbi:MAG TPA: small basic protein [Pirellulales bacterium]|nr:small basic protein [Pirellulales bacterium]
MYQRAQRVTIGNSEQVPAASPRAELWENDDMTMDKSLQLRTGLVRSRSVLSRGERIARLQASDKWQQGQSPLGLPKVRVYKLSLKKKKKRKEEEGEGEVAAAATAATPEKKPEKKADKKK